MSTARASASATPAVGKGARFELAPTCAASRVEARAWLYLGLSALVGSGLFAVLIVLSRTPFVQDGIPWLDFFHTALVVHVDLSVLVWFIAFAGVMWSLHGPRRGFWCGWVAFAGVALGTIMMAVAPFASGGEALMSNYIPVLNQPVFLSGLGLLAVGFGVLTARSLMIAPAVGPHADGSAALRFGLNTSIVAAALGLGAFVASMLGMPPYLESKEYFEILFWGGGHVMQFFYTQLMLVAWLWLASVADARPWISPRAVLVLFGWGLLSVFLTPVFYLAYEVGSFEHRELFTWQMAFGGSLASLPLGLAIAIGLWVRPRTTSGGGAQRTALWWSILLFGVGGILGFAIDGSDVTVPAHYHGSIVGVTLAFMGMTYHLLPLLGFRVPHTAAAVWQARIYGAGQLLHVSGLALSGLLGVQRKTAGRDQGLDTVEQVAAMGLMGVGGLIAVLGGLLFLAVTFAAMRGGRSARSAGARANATPPESAGKCRAREPG